MDGIITRTKILPPRHRRDALPRQRLLDTFLDLVEYRLVLTIAPAGYGKTFALVDLAGHVEMAVCWYSLSAVDQDPHRFFAHFIASIAQQFPQFGAESDAALRDFSGGQRDVDRLVTTVVNDLYAHTTRHFLLVIDDYHLVDDVETIGSFVSQFVQSVDDNCHVILSSRTLLSLPDLPLLVARGYVVGIDHEDLAFQEEELRTLVWHTYGIALDSTTAEEMVSAAEGWITGILLSAQSNRWSLGGRMRPVRASGVSLYGYLAHQVLDQQSPVLREFLLRTSLIDELDAGLCQEMFPPEWCPADESWHSLIDAVLHNNLFVLPVGDEDGSLRYHHLFQEFLQQRLAVERPLEEGAILLRLVDVYLARHQWEQAYLIAQRSKDHKTAVQVIEAAGLRLVQAGRIVLLAKWLDDLPGATLATRPNLLSLRGYSSTLLGQVEQGLALLNQAATTLNAEDDRMSLAFTLAYRSISYRFMGNYGQSLEDADRALGLFDSLDRSAPDTGDVQALALRSKGTALRMMGKLDPAIQWLKSSLATYKKLGDAQNEATLSMEIAIAYSNAGRHALAFPLFEAALEAWQTLHNLVGQSNILNSLGVHYHQHGEYRLALRALMQALDCARRSGYPRMEAFSLASLGDLYVDVRMWEAGEELYRQAYGIARRIDERFLVIYLEIARAMVAWSAEQWGNAYRCLDTAGQLVLDRNSSYEWGIYRAAMGRFYLAQGMAAAAGEPLCDAYRCFSDGGQKTEAAEAKLFEAAAAQMSNQDQLAVANLEEALELIAGLEIQLPISVVGCEVKGALQQIQVSKRSAGDLWRLLAKIDEFQASLPHLRRDLRQGSVGLLSRAYLGQPDLAIHALGRTEVIAKGRLITNSDWKSRTARDLFFCLLSHSEGLSKEQIGIVFWPDCSPRQLKSRFKNAIYRLRSAIGLDVVRFEENVYRFNRSMDYEYDVELLVGGIVDAESKENPRDQINAYRMALQYYRGIYLPETDMAWRMTESERLHRTFIEANLRLAHLHFQIGQIDDALQCCHRILEQDPCLEDAHRLAMRIHASTGNRAGVARQYAQCQQSLQEEIAAPPSLQTEELYEILMQ